MQFTLVLICTRHSSQCMYRPDVRIGQGDWKTAQWTDKRWRDGSVFYGSPWLWENTAWIIRAYTEDIGRFASAKKYAAFYRLVPCVQDSNEIIHHGKLTKRGHQELRTDYVQLVLGIRRCKDTSEWRIMQLLNYMKKNKGSGKSIVAAVRKMAEIVWALLTEKQNFNSRKMMGKYKPMNLVEQTLATSN